MAKKNISKIINLMVFNSIFFLFDIFSANAGLILERLERAAIRARYDIDETNSAIVAGRFIAIFLSLLGVIFIILAIYAGYLWMTARGNVEKVEEAKKILTEAIIGIVIIIGAYVISYFIVTSITTGYFKPEQL